MPLYACKWHRNRSYHPKWGGGAELLDSPDLGENSDIEIPKTDDNNLTNSIAEDSEKITYTFKTADDYFIDFNVGEKLAETTITGNGTENSPYIINCLEDLLYLTKVSLYNKRVKLNCDIILNDEVFDENGTPSGGDGVVYSWCGFKSNYGLYFDGQGHTIKGLYINDRTKDCVQFMKSSQTTFEFKNTKFESVYLVGQCYVGAVGYSIKKCENVEVMSGYIYGATSVAGVCRAGNEFRNVINRAEVTCNSNYTNTSGIVAMGQNTTLIENCENYGNIVGYEITAGIIGDVYSNDIVIRNCKNYGNVKGVSKNCGGIIALVRVSNSSKHMIGCENYGKIEGLGNRGGLIGYVDSSISIVNCKNYGEVVDSNSSVVGSFFGRIATVLSNESVNIHLLDCVSYTNGKVPIFGYAAKEGNNYNEDFSLVIARCKFYYLNEKQTRPILINSMVSSFDLIIRDSYIYFKNFINQYFVGAITSSTLDISNTLIEYDTKVADANFKLVSQKTSPTYKVNGLIVNLSNGKNCYYGDNFSSFYISWKTGKIGIKALDGVGFYQGKVDEEMLKYKGYEKREI